MAKMNQTKQEWLTIDVLNNDRGYQREWRKPWSQKIAENFDPESFGTLAVSQRDDGTYWIIDGQHRVQALKMLGWNGQLVPCTVHYGQTRKQEAVLFHTLNDFVRPSAIDSFKAAVAGGYPAESAINKIVESCGYRVCRGSDPAHVNAVSALMQIYWGIRLKPKRPCPDVLRAVLETVREAWGADPNATTGSILLGLGLLIIRDGNALDLATMADRLAKFPGGPAGLIGKARGLCGTRGGKVADSMAEIMVNTYNKGKRTQAIKAWRS